jgi:hypothetical protein
MPDARVPRSLQGRRGNEEDVHYCYLQIINNNNE